MESLRAKRCRRFIGKFKPSIDWQKVLTDRPDEKKKLKLIHALKSDEWLISFKEPRAITAINKMYGPYVLYIEPKQDKSDRLYLWDDDIPLFISPHLPCILCKSL
jgi:hypothetical protein